MAGNSRNKRDGLSRSAKKREARAVEALAQKMVESSEGLCRRLPLPEDLREELESARRIKSRSARKRELKHLAALLRHDEETVQAVRAAFDSVGEVNRAERDRFHRIEELRDALCDPDRFSESVEIAAAEVPGFDRQVFTGLARRVHENGDKRAFREIFRRLRVLLETTAEA